jgi:hypothetical protein
VTESHVHKFDHLRFCTVCSLSAEQVFSGRPPSPRASDTRDRDRKRPRPRPKGDVDTSPKVRVCVDCNEKYRPINIKLAELEET